MADTTYSSLAVRLADSTDRLCLDTSGYVTSAALLAARINKKLTTSGIYNKMTQSSILARLTQSGLLNEFTASGLLSKIPLSAMMAYITTSAIIAELTASGLRSKLTNALTAAELKVSALDDIRKKGDLLVTMNQSGHGTLNTPGVVAEFMNVTVFTENVLYAGCVNPTTSAVTLKFKYISQDGVHGGKLTTSALLANSGLQISGGYDYQVI